jgi:hypothetical protein
MSKAFVSDVLALSVPMQYSANGVEKMLWRLNVYKYDLRAVFSKNSEHL